MNEPVLNFDEPPPLRMRSQMFWSIVIAVPVTIVWYTIVAAININVNGVVQLLVLFCGLALGFACWEAGKLHAEYFQRKREARYVHQYNKLNPDSPIIAYRGRWYDEYI
jgi:hypothetical protein